MNALETAKEFLAGSDDSTNTWPSIALAYAAIAQVEATDRQTEQLKRIADALEGISSAYVAAEFGYIPPQDTDGITAAGHGYGE